MSSQVIDRCVHELDETHAQMLTRLAALQMYNQQPVTDETKVWLNEQIGWHRERIALLEGVSAGLKTVAGTDYPDLAMGEMPPEVQANLDDLHAKLTQTMDTMAATMNVLRPRVGHKAVAVAESPSVSSVEPAVESIPVEVTEPAQEQRRGRREGVER